MCMYGCQHLHLCPGWSNFKQHPCHSYLIGWYGITTLLDLSILQQSGLDLYINKLPMTTFQFSVFVYVHVAVCICFWIGMSCFGFAVDWPSMPNGRGTVFVPEICSSWHLQGATIPIGVDVSSSLHSLSPGINMSSYYVWFC